MTTSTPTRSTAPVLRQAAVRATLAPSVHNTQPWHFVIGPDSLEVHADRSRRLRVLDPDGRQLTISCGCALFNARVALDAAGYDAVTERFPDPARPTVLARLRIGDEPARATPPAASAPAAQPTQPHPLGALDAVIEHRQSNRRRFSDDPVAEDVVAELIAAVASEQAQLFVIDSPVHRSATARLCQEADKAENADPAYRAELRAWTSADANRRDGVPAMAVPHVDGSADDDVPIRDFDTTGMGWLPADTRSNMDQCLLLLGSSADTAAAWLRSGEALERVLLVATRHGYAASMFTQVIEVPRTRYLLRSELDIDMHPHVLLRIGHAPTTPASRRRRLVDVLSEAP